MSVALDSTAVGVAFTRLRSALEAAIAASPATPWALVAIRNGGIELADRLAAALAGPGKPALGRGTLDITLYRDDLYTGLERPVLGRTDLPFEVSGTGVVLVDDVLFTGRTVRAALGEIHDFGRPAFVRLAVLVDRGHRELPIAADYVGATVSTRLQDRVEVAWNPDEVTVRRGA